MKRRNFFKSALWGSTLSLSPLFLSCKQSSIPKATKKPENKISRVKKAMLCMQRASWEQGVAAQAFLELGDKETVYLMAKEAALRQTEEGRLSVVYQDTGVNDPAASGEAVLFAANMSGDKDLKAAADKMLDYLLKVAPKTDTGIIYHMVSETEIWIDSMYMGPPFLAVAGHYKEALKQVEGIRNFLWDPESNLFSHRWDVVKKQFMNKDFWGVGNGWAAAGMARIIRTLPDNMIAEKEKLVLYTKQVIDGCLTHIRNDGLFHNVVNNPNTFIETNLSQMLAYTIFRGVGEKWLDGSYWEFANKMRTAAHAKVDEFGFVQGVCGAPFFNKPGRATEGQAFFLLMEAAFNRLKV